MTAGTPIWFASHELRLAWRDWLSMMTAGKPHREPWLFGILAIFVLFMHGVAYAIVAPYASDGIASDRQTLILVTGSLLLSWTLMLSQAIESVTRAFYAREDLDLILSSPAPARSLFAVRIGAIAVSTTLLSAALAIPFINALILCDGIRWLFAYGVFIAMGLFGASLATLMTVGLFKILGAKRTRLLSQIVAAVVGASFVIGIQLAAILSFGSVSRISIFESDFVGSLMPDAASLLFLPARAAMGNGAGLLILLAIGVAALTLTIYAVAPRFAAFVTAAAGVSFEPAPQQKRRFEFKPQSPRTSLLRKELLLLRRDPWLTSQTLMQLLYLLPPALMLWIHFGDETSALIIVVPILVMASGQLAGGLAWLAVSGEDAPELIMTAPIKMRTALAAKIQAVMSVIGLVTCPLLIGLFVADFHVGVVACLGVAIASASATAVQIWFRAQAQRSHFSRRQTSSRMATLAEAMSSILWAGTAAVAAAGNWAAFALAFLALLTLLLTYVIRPRMA